MTWFQATGRENRRAYYVRADGAQRIVAISADATHRISVGRDDARTYLMFSKAQADQRTAQDAEDAWLDANPWFTKRIS